MRSRAYLVLISFVPKPQDTFGTFLSYYSVLIMFLSKTSESFEYTAPFHQLHLLSLRISLYISLIPVFSLSCLSLSQLPFSHSLYPPSHPPYAPLISLPPLFSSSHIPPFLLSPLEYCYRAFSQCFAQYFQAPPSHLTVYFDCEEIPMPCRTVQARVPN